jgi:cytochrome P450
VRLEPFDHGYDRDPAATWRRLLTTGPAVGFDPALSLWVIAGYGNARDVLADARRFSNAATLTPITPPAGTALTLLTALPAAPGIVTADPPEHTRLRAILRSILPTTADTVGERWLPLVMRRTKQLVDELTEYTTVDLVDQFSRRLSLLVILDVLGLPAEDATMICRWSDGVVEFLWGRPTATQQLTALRGLLEFRAWCRRLIGDRITRSHRSPGVLDDLLTYRGGNEARLPAEQVASLLVDLLLAGWASTAAAIGHAIEHALADAWRWTRIPTDPHHRATLVEESLRYSPAVDGCLRRATADTTVAGVTIPAGGRCLVLLGSAGHDPTVYPDPEFFDPARAGLSRHLAFGYGPHSCIGAALARLQVSTALDVLARRLPTLRLSVDYARQFRPSVILRAHTVMPARTADSRCPVPHASAEAPR